MAIAITLLILEFKIPPLGRHKNWMEIKSALNSKMLIPILGIYLSFTVISNLWIRHHELFEHVVTYNKKLIKYNLRFLFFIMLLPLTTSFMLEDDNPWFLQYFFYFADLGFCSLFNYLLYQTVYNKKEPLSSVSNERTSQRILVGSIINVVAFFATAIWSFYSKEKAFYPLLILILIPVLRVYHLVKAYFRKRKTTESLQKVPGTEIQGCHEE